MCLRLRKEVALARDLTQGQAEEVYDFSVCGPNLGEEVRRRLIFEITAFDSRKDRSGW